MLVDYITNSFFNSRTYFISSPEKEEIWLVDCGDTDRIMELVGGKTIEGVLLTHVHFDHIYGLAALMNRFPKVKIITNAAGVEALKSPKLNVSRYHSEYPDIAIDVPNNIQVVAEGNKLEIMGVPVRVYETPGHAPSCLTYIIEDKVFTGDAYIPGVKVFTGFPYANRQQAQMSVERILQLSKKCIVMPGHTVQDVENNSGEHN